MPVSPRMSSFELKEVGTGRFELVGEMSFETADKILESSRRLFGNYAGLEVDLSHVKKADSAGLALLLEWKAQANQKAGAINFLGMPDSLVSIARTTEVSDLI
jgi:phospholipid transport system transporter-binding protein